MGRLQIFKSSEFGELGVMNIEGKEYFPASDCARMLGYSNPHKAIRDHCKGVTKRSVLTEGGNQEMNFIPEGDLYRLIVRSKLPSAEKFERWVFDEVLPTVRKTGGYVANEDIFIDTYLPYADETTKLLFRSTLETVRKQNQLIEFQKKEIEHKEDVIIGLVDDVDLAVKRQRLQDIIKKGYKNPRHIVDRWNLLYKEFERKYHVDLNRRLQSESIKDIKPKIKNKLDYIDRVMDKIPELYELGCKIFENDVEKLKSEWFDAVERVS